MNETQTSEATMNDTANTQQGEGEDWLEAMAERKGHPQPPADPSLAGLYVVEHGELYFGEEKIVPKGRKVRLTAEDARSFMSHDPPLVRKL